MKKTLALQNHLKDLKIKVFYLIISFIITLLICIYYRIHILFLISRTFLLLKKKFIFTKISTAFWIYLKLSTITSLIFILPLFFYFLGLFLLKGFYIYQNKIWTTVFIIFYITIILTLINFYKYVFPFILTFFLSFESNIGPLSLTLEARIDQYINFYIFFIFFILLLFIIPFLLLVVTLFFKINKNSLRKYIYIPLLFFFILFAPPDLSIQLLLIPFLFVITEFILLSILILKYFLLYINEESRIRTCDEQNSTDLQSAAFNHSAISSKKG